MSNNPHLNESLINGMFNQRQGVSDASLTISEQSRIDVRAFASSLAFNSNYRLGLGQTPSPNVSSPLAIAKQELAKFNQCLTGFGNISQQIRLCNKQSEDVRKNCQLTKLLKEKASNNIDALKHEVMISRTNNVPHKLKQEFETLKIEFKKNQLQLKKLENEKEEMKSVKDGILLQELKFENELRKQREQICRLDVQSVMGNMLSEIESRFEMDRVINQNKFLSTQVQLLNGEVERSKEEQKSLSNKTRQLEEKLKATENPQQKLRLKGSVIMPYESQLHLCPSDNEIEDLSNKFSLYIENIKNKLLSSANFHKHHQTQSKKTENQLFLQLQSNSVTFGKIKELLKTINTPESVQPHGNRLVDVSNIAHIRKSIHSNGDSNVFCFVGDIEVSPSQNVIASKSNNRNTISSVRDNSLNKKSIPKINVNPILKQNKILKLENQNLKQTNKCLKLQLIQKIFQCASLQYIESLAPSAPSSMSSSLICTPTAPTQMAELELKFKDLEKKYKNSKIGYQNISSKINEMLLYEKKMEFDLLKERTQRRKLHNEIEDMMGSIRVYCRILPGKKGKQSQLEYSLNPSTQSLLLLSTKKQYKFDALFGQETSQEEIFDNTKKLIVNAAEGYNVCIFAYGQTGSGKTYTLAGDELKGGIVLRSINQLFAMKKQRKQLSKMDISMSIFEIQLDGKDFTTEKKEKERDKQIKLVNEFILNSCQSKQQNAFVKLSSADQGIGEYLKKIKDRELTSTMTNIKSHLLLTFLIDTENVLSRQKRTSRLHIIDIANSQSLIKLKCKDYGDNSYNNTSTSNICNVLTCFTSKDQPKYRDNKLTNLLRDCFSGNYKMLMFVNISSDADSTHETLTNLNLAREIKMIDRKHIEIRKVAIEESRRSSLTRNYFKHNG